MNRKLARLAASGLAMAMLSGLTLAPTFADARDRNSNSGSNPRRRCAPPRKPARLSPHGLRLRRVAAVARRLTPASLTVA